LAKLCYTIHIVNSKESEMDKALKTIPGVGEAGIDTAASAGNGSFYVKMYDGSHDVCGFDSIDEAYAELLYIYNTQSCEFG
jgi:hypothetical protein